MTINSWLISRLMAGGDCSTTVTCLSFSPASLCHKWLFMFWCVVGAGIGVQISNGATAVMWGNTSNGRTNVPAAATNLIALTAGADHSIALRADGAVVGWGLNTSGQTNPPASASNVVSIAAGYDHNLVLRNGGTLVAWGNSINGKTTIPAAATNSILSAIAAGTSHNLVLRTNGTVFAWGINSFAITNVPSQATGVIRINAGNKSSGFSHSLALRRDGTVVSWGYNTSGQTNPPASATNIVAVAAGADFSLGLKADGTVVGWGANGAGQITIPATATNVVAIAAGAAHSLALRSDGSIVGWGLNTSGQRTIPIVVSNSTSVTITAGSFFSGCLLGDGSPVFTDSLGELVAYSNRVFTLNALAVGAPPLSYQWQFNGVDIPTADAGTLILPSVQSTNAGLYSVVVSNSFGVISGIVANVSVEIAPELPSVLVPPASQTVFAGTNVVFNVTAGGHPAPSYRWQFFNTNLPFATNASYTIPYALTNHAGNYRVVLSNSVGVITSQVATLTVTLPDWPVIRSWPTNRAAPYGSPVTLTVAPYNAGPVTYGWQLNGTNLPHVGGAILNFSSFTPSDGGVYRVTASNQFGGSISPEFEIAAVPVAVWGSGLVTSLPLSLTNAVTLGAGAQHAVALKADGQVVAWGDNVVINQSVFPNTTNNYGMATTPSGLSNVAAIAVGTYHNVAVRSDGTVFAWGRNTGGQTNVPATATNVIAVAAGDSHSLALRADGTVVAWGTNTSGQLNVPLDATNIVAIAAGNAHSLALRGDGRLFAWGSASAIQPMPTTVANAIAISARANYCIAIKLDGTKVVWGNSLPTQASFTGNPLLSFPSSDHISAVAGYSHGLFLHAGGTVQALYSFSISGSDPRLTPPTWLANVVSVAAGNVSLALMRPPNGLPSMQVAQRSSFVGSPAVFSTHIEGQQSFNSSSLTGYQWRFGVTNISGATNSYLVLPSVTAQQAGDYSVVLKDYTGTVTSQVANLTVSAPPLPQIATHPLSRTVGAGTNVTFSFALTYGIPGWTQWQFNGADLLGVIGSSLTLSNVQSANAGDYRVIVTNLSGSITSQVATLTVTSMPPAFVAQPTSRSVAEGFSTTLSALATGTDPIAYQWSLNDVEIPGATESLFAITNASAVAMGTYRVVATNIVGSVTSSPAIVTLVPLTVWIGNPTALTNAPVSTTNAIALAAGSSHALALLANGSVAAWGDNSCGQTTVPGGASGVVRIAAGELHSLALRDDGTLVAWGNNYRGQGSSPAGLSNVVEIASGLMHNVALRADGTVVSWGWNFGGETNTPAGLSNVVAVAAGGLQTLALKRDGTLAVWGVLNHIPDSATNVTGIAVGYGHCVALQSNGNVIAWGSTSTNSGLNISFGCSGFSVSGSLAVKTNLIPTPANATNIVAIAAGRHHIVALRADGEVIAWGDNSAGQLNTPAGGGVTGIAAGKYQTLALLGSPVPQLGGFRTSRFAGEATTVLLNTTASGRPPLIWAWQLNSTNIAGSNQTFVTFPSALTNDSGIYPFVVSNSFGSITGSISLTVTAQPPVILTQPVGLLMGLGSNATFTSTAKGSLPLNYQWRRDGVPLVDGGGVSGVNTTVLTLQNVQLTDTGNYSLAVTNHAGFTISTNASLLVFDESPLASALDTTNLIWTTGGTSGWHWQTATNRDGVDAAETGPFPYVTPIVNLTNWVETTVTGPVTVSFWWRAYGWISDVISFSVDGVDRIGIQLLSDVDWQQRTCYVPAGQHTLRWTYKCHPFAGTSTAWLDQIGFTNATVPTITTHPTSRAVTVSSSTTFSTAASGTDPLAYQWQFNGLDLANATNASLTLTKIELTNAGNYQLIVTNIAGAATSSVAILTVNGSLPVLQTGPSSFTAAPTTSPALTSSFIGSTPLNFQWQLNHVDVPGGTDMSLVLSNLQPHQAGLYRVIASNELGTTISAEAQVTIVPVAAWGINNYSQARVPSWIGDVVGIAAGETHSTALLRDGTVTTWGIASLSSPTQFPTGSDRFATIVGAGRHILGLRTNGTVLPFGYVGAGLGNVPASATNILTVATGGLHDLALRSDGIAFAWGTNDFGQTDIPPAATNLVAIAAGRNFSLAGTDDGGLLAWGTNSHGQLTLPTTKDFVAVAGGQYHALALRENGSVVAWGNNDSAQTDVPPGLTNIVFIAAGDDHSLALRSDGKIFVWGSDTSGQSTVWDALTNVVAIAGGESHSLALVGDGRPVITLPPQRRRLEPGGNTALRVFATGAGHLAYQWKHEGTNVPGATNATLLTSLYGNYSVTVSNSLGTTDSTLANVLLTTPVLRFDTSPGGMFLATDGLHLRLMGLSGKGPVVVLASTDFTSWTPILTNPPVIGQFSFVDSNATNLVRRFYRAMETETLPTPVLRFLSPSWTQTPTGSLFRATLTGLIGSGPVSVFGSTNLTGWSVVATNPPVSGEWIFNHLQSNAPTLYWYRAAEER